MKNGPLTEIFALGAVVLLGAAVLAATTIACGRKKSTNSPIVVLAVAKDTIQVQTDLDSTEVTEQESNLGDLIADAARQTGNAEIGLISADEIVPMRIPAGNVPASEIIKTLSYEGDPRETVVVLYLKGSQISHAAARSVSRVPHPFDGFLQISGMRVTYKSDTQQPRKVVVTTEQGPIDPNRNYRVATTRSLANGSFGYFKVWTKKNILEDTGISIANGLSAYLSAHKTINANVEGRITAQ